MSDSKALDNLAKARAKKKARTKKHPWRSTHILHHDDGTHTITHEHEKGMDHDQSHAVPDLDGVHDNLEEHLGEPNDGENELPPGVAGPEPVAQ